MEFRQRPHTIGLRFAVALLSCLVLSLTLVGLTAASAQAADPTITLENTAFTLSTPTPTIASSGQSFDWRVSFKPATKLTAVTLRFDVLRNGSTLIYRRTRTLTDVAPAGVRHATAKTTGTRTTGKTTAAQAGARSEQFVRTLDGLGMRSGTYTVQVEITAVSGTDRETATLTSKQFVYDATRTPLTVVEALHFSAAPMRNADGTFATDPAAGASQAQRRALDQLIALARANTKAHIVLYFSPLLLDDWTAASQGYRVRTPGSTTTVDGNATVAQSYAATLAALKSAVGDGYLALGTVGYSDPNVTRLIQADLTDDIALQYERGLTSLGTLRTATGAAQMATAGNTQGLTAATLALRSSEASGTAFFGSALNVAALDELRSAGITATFVPRSAVRTRGVAMGRLPGGMLGFVADGPLSTALTTHSSNVFVTDLLRRYSALDTTHIGGHYADTTSELLVLHGVVDDVASAGHAIDNTRALLAQPWAQVRLPREVAPTATSRLRALRLAAVKKAQLTHKERAIYRARRAAEGLIFATDESTDALSARSDSLIAENGAPHSSMTRRLIYVHKAQKAADTIFGNVVLKLSSVTLSGNKGSIPISIKNGNKRGIRARLTVTSGNGLTVHTPGERLIALPPQETFLEPKVFIKGVSSAPLKLSLTAGSYVMCEKTVKISASYLDTIGIVVIVVLIGVILGVVIYRRVQTADPEKNLFEHELPEDGEDYER